RHRFTAGATFDHPTFAGRGWSASFVGTSPTIARIGVCMAHSRFASLYAERAAAARPLARGQPGCAAVNSDWIAVAVSSTDLPCPVSALARARIAPLSEPVAPTRAPPPLPARQ